MKSGDLSKVSGVVLLLLAVCLVLLMKKQDSEISESQDAPVLAAQGHVQSRVSLGLDRAEREDERRETKGAERPRSEEMADTRRRVRRQHLIDRIESLKAGGLGNVHPAMKSARQELNQLEEEMGLPITEPLLAD